MHFQFEKSLRAFMRSSHTYLFEESYGASWVDCLLEQAQPTSFHSDEIAATTCTAGSTFVAQLVGETDRARRGPFG